MCANSLQKTITLLCVYLSLFLAPLCVKANLEYVIGLTTQGMRNASVEEVEVGFNYQLAKMTKDKTYEMKIKVYPTVDQLSDAINTQKVMGYFGPPLLFLQNKDTFDTDYIFTPVLSNKVMQRYLLLTRKDNAIDKFEKLKNKSISYCETDEVGIFYLRKLIKEKKLGQLDTFFSKLMIKKNPSLAISAVFFKETQATIVLESDLIVASELNPQLKTQLISIEVSPEYITNMLAIRKNIEGPLTKSGFEAHALTLGSAIGSKKILQTYNYGSLKKIKLEDLNSVRDLINSLNDDKGLLK
jgi:ABC-type phosphate/phosphonate transport system substrate-binding protein